MGSIAPPAYSAIVEEGNSPLPASSTPIPMPYQRPARSIQDTRALILGNAAILKPRRQNDSIELIVAKHQPSTYQPSAEEPPPAVSHYAFLVMRRPTDIDINIVLKGEPRDSIEEALDYLLERTESIMEEMLLRHGRHVDTLCCIECNRSVRPDRPRYFGTTSDSRR